MTIHVRIMSAQALAQLKAMEAQSHRTALGVGSVGKQAQWGLPYLSKWGNQVQWAGRQLMYNFTLPIALAMGAATKFALENEKGMVRVAKVYGDAGKFFDRVSQTELPALEDAFAALSNRFGVHRAEVLAIAGDWAAAGASGVALAKSVKLTLETMVLGEIEAVEATKQLIAIQAQYGQNIVGLTNTIDVLNMVENQTGATMKDLMVAFARSAGTARVAGVDIRELGAMIAALVPSSGSAATAGNALKTIISRLISPTTEAKNVLAEVGIEVDKFSWNSMTATQRLETLATKFEDLDSAQKGHLATLLGSRWQLNRLTILLGDITNQNGYYQRSLESTADATLVFKQRQQELNAVLESSPQRVQQAWVILKNSIADVMVPLLPFIVYIISEVARLANAFAKLEPEVQKLALAGLVFLAVIGPFARYIGAVANMFGLLSAATHWLAVKFGILKVFARDSSGALIMVDGQAKKVRGGLIGLAKSMLLLPFKPFIFAWGVITAKLLLMGKAVLPSLIKMNIAVGKWMFGAPFLKTVVGNLVLLKGIVVAHLRNVFLGAWRTVTGPIVKTFGLMTGALGRIWIDLLAGLKGLMAPFIKGMQLAWFTLMTGLKRIYALGAIALKATGLFLHSSLLIATTQFKITMMAVWAALMSALQWIQIAGGQALHATWKLIHGGFVLITLASSAAIKQIWLGTMLMGRKFVTGLAAVGTAALTVTKAAALGAVLAFTKIPLLIFAIWKGLWLGILKLAPLAFKALTGPIGLAAMAALGIIYAFRDQIAEAWTKILEMFQNVGEAMPQMFAPVGEFFSNLVGHIVDAFWALPEGVRNALLTVLNIVKAVAIQIYEWMSYLNPFARHSPSLVESVTKGMDHITRQYARAGSLGNIFSKAARDLAEYKRVSSSLGTAEFQEERQSVKKGAPQALGIFDALKSDLAALQPLLARQGQLVSQQEGVVEGWKVKLDAANSALDTQQRKLDLLQSRLDTVTQKYEAHKSAMQAYADAPIAGMSKMEDQIFANELAQKKLRLEMMNWEDANGSIDDIRNRISLLYGDIELLQGQASELRMSGAGSEITGPIEDQIRRMEEQAKALSGGIATSPIAKMQTEMEKLQREGETLDLQQAIKYDPMVREIDKLVNAQKELKFEDIISGITRERAAMDELQPSLDRMTRAVQAQEAVVKRSTAARDALQFRYDTEQKKLEQLQESYRATEDVIRDVESALRDMGGIGSEAISKAKAAADKANGGVDSTSLGVKTFRAAAGANWPDPGGRQGIGRESRKNETIDIDQFTQDTLDDMNSIFGGFDMFAPLKKWWSRTWAWLKENVGPVVTAVFDGIRSAVSRIPNPMPILKSIGDSKVGKAAANVWDTLADVFRTVVKWVGRLWNLFGPDITRIKDAFVKFGKDIWNKVGPQLAGLGELIEPLSQAFKNIWRIVKPLIAVLAVTFVAGLKVAASVISHTIGPVLDFVIDIFKAVVRVARGLIEVFIGIFTLDPGMIWNGIVNIFMGLANGIWAIIKGLGKTLWGIFKGIVVGIWEFFVWLYDILIGNSVIPDLVDGIFKVFRGLFKLGKWIWENALKPVWKAVVFLWKNLIKPALMFWWSGFKIALRGLLKLGEWVWNSVLKPVWGFIKSLWTNYIQPALKFWWTGFKIALSGLLKLGAWVWNNVLRPVWYFVKSVWKDYIRPGLAAWWEGLKTVWNKLTGLGEWFWNNVLAPIKNKFIEAWNIIKTWLQDNSDKILKPFHTVVRGIITAINWMIKGLNKLADLPGIEFKINTIALPFAQGGNLPSRKVGGGFKTTGARAIVGEGKPNYPEYVIPTDPTYRNRARQLYQAAGNRLGMAGIPMHADGGVLGSIKDAFGTVKDWGSEALEWTGEKAKKAASTIYQPFKKLAELALRKTVDWPIGRKVGYGALDLVDNWINSADQVFEKKMSSVNFATSGGPPVQGGDWERMFWRGHQFNKRTVRMIQSAEEILGLPYNISQGSFSSSVAASGGTHSGGGAMDSTFPNTQAGVNALRRVGFAAWLREPSQGPWPYHIHAIALGDIQASQSARDQMGAYLRGEDGLAANGAIVRATRGGRLMRVGEGGRDEAILPLPRAWKQSIQQPKAISGDTHIHISGNLEFPNIKSGDDAELFINNLQILAKD